MKKILAVLLLIVSFFGYSQNHEKYIPTIAWQTYIQNVTVVNDSTYTADVRPIDPGEPGAFTREIGNYLMDNRGLRYKIISSNATSVTVVDVFHEGFSPYEGKIGFVYLSSGDGEAPSLPDVTFEQLDRKAWDYSYRIDNNILWGHGIEYDSPFRRIVLDTTYSPSGTEPKGVTFWDSANGTYTTVLGNNVMYQHGKELFIDGQNDTGEDIPNGTPVEFAGGIGNSGNFRIRPALVTASDPSYYFIGVATEDIPSGGVGKITTTGKVRGIPTNGSAHGETWVSGTILYPSSTIRGAFTMYPPQAPYPAIPAALVISTHATNGTLEVRPTFPQRVQDSPDVNGTPLEENGQMLIWNNDSSYFDFDYNLFNQHLGHGIYDRFETTISYDNTTRTITVTPSGSLFDYIFEGKKYFSATIVRSHPATTGTYFLYFDSNNELQFSATPWSIMTDVPVASVFYDAVSGLGFAMDERHSYMRNRLAHREFHQAIGTYLVDPFGISDYTVAPSSPTNDDNTFSLSAGVIADEDLQHALGALADNSTYTILYRVGSGSDWSIALRSTPFVYSTYAQYNEYVGGSWTLSQLSTNDYMNVWVMKLGAVSSQYQTILILDQDVHDTYDEAFSQKLYNMNLDGFPVEEAFNIYKITFMANASYSTVGKVRIAGVTQELGNISVITGNDPITNHNSLSGLQGGAAGEYYHLTGQEHNRVVDFRDSVYANEQQSLQDVTDVDSTTTHLITVGGLYSTESIGVDGDIFVTGNVDGVNISDTVSYIMSQLDYTLSHVTDDHDTSATNELNYEMTWNDALNTVGVTDAGGNKAVQITGFADSTTTAGYPDQWKQDIHDSILAIPAPDLSGYVTSVGATSPVASSGGTTPTISLNSGYGDTQNPYGSKTAKYFLAAPNAAAGVPSFRAIEASDIPTLNQNTTGSAGSVTNSITFNNSGAGSASGITYNGSAARTISYNTIGAEPTLTKGNLTEATSSVLTITGGTGSVIGSGTSIQVKQAGTSQSGYLSFTDWNTFNNKQSALTTGDFTESVTGLQLSATRQVIGGAVDLSLSSGYEIPLSTDIDLIYENADSISVHRGDINQNAADIATKQDILTTGTLSEGVAGLYFTDSRQVIGGSTSLELSLGYEIPLSVDLDAYDAAVDSIPALRSDINQNASDITSLQTTKQDNISLTTTGTSGAATFVGSTLNIPNYTLSGLGYAVPTLQQVTTAGNTTTDGVSIYGVLKVGGASPAFSNTNLHVEGNGITIRATGTDSYGSGIKFFNPSRAHYTAGVKGSSFVVARTSSNDDIWDTTPFDILSLSSTGLISTVGNITIGGTPTANSTHAARMLDLYSGLAGKQDVVTLTTNNNSGAATLVGSTLNIPNYVTGLTSGYLPYFDGSKLSNSLLNYSNNVYNLNSQLYILQSSSFPSSGNGLNLAFNNPNAYIQAYDFTNNLWKNLQLKGSYISMYSSGSERIRIAETTGNILINTTTDNTTDKLQVNGTATASQATLDTQLPQWGQVKQTISDSLLSINDTLAVHRTEINQIVANSHNPVTLAGTPDYITISGQEITRHEIDLASDVTGSLPSSNIENATEWNLAYSHATTDNDISASNEIQTITSTDGSVTVTPSGINYDLSVSIPETAGGVSLFDTIVQAGHGLSVGKWISYDASGAVQYAQADTAIDADVIGITYYVSTDTIVYQYSGIYAGGTWAEGSNYYLSTTSAGDAVVSQTYNPYDVYLFLGTGVEGGLNIEIDLGVEIAPQDYVTSSDLSGLGFDGTLISGYLPYWDGSKLANSPAYKGTYQIAFGDNITSTFSAWNGSGVFGKNGTDKVMIGYLTSSTNGAVIAGHNSVLDAWAPLNINGTEIKFRRNEVEIARFASSSGNLLINTTTDNGTDKLQVNGSMIATSIKKSGGTSSEALMADGSVQNERIQDVSNGDKTASFTHDASVASIGNYNLSTTSAVTISIHNLQSGMMGTIFADIGSSVPSSITVTSYSDAGSTTLTNKIEMTAAPTLAANKMYRVTYTCASDGTNTEVILSYGIEP